MSSPWVGAWSCEALGSAFWLGADGHVLVDAPSGIVRGRYGIVGNQLVMQDEAGNSTQYVIVALDERGMLLLDANGQTLVCTRFDAQAHAGGAVLAQAHGLRLTEGERAVGLGLLQLMLERPATPQEIEELAPSTIADFEARPLRVLAQIDQLAGALAQVHARTEPVEIGLARQAIFGALYGALQAQPEAAVPPLMQVILRSIEVLAFDPRHQLILTDRDVAAMVQYAAFLRMLAGHPPDETAPSPEALAAELVAAFPTMALDQKQSVCSAALLWRVIDGNWQRFDQAQRASWQAQYQAELQRQRAQADAEAEAHEAAAREHIGDEAPASGTRPSGGTINRATWDMMMDMSLNTHATALNIIENIGGTGNYWEVTYS